MTATTSAPNPNDLRDRFFEQIEKLSLWSNARNLRIYLEYIFNGVPLPNASMLDVGAGTGLSSVYAAAAGARRVVALEPEAAGSNEGMIDAATRLAQATGVTQVERRAETFQHYEPAGETFDVVILHNSINHLDEPACIRYLEDPAARATYRGLAERLAQLVRPGGHLIIADATRNNFWPLIKVRNPFARTIEWHKHQSPRTWAALFGEVGFEQPRIRWSAFNRLGKLGQIFLGNGVAAYFLMGHFCLTMRRRDHS